MIELIKKMRMITGIGILECKKYLLKYNNDLNLAILNYKKEILNNINCNNQLISNNGVLLVKNFKYASILLRVNCITDFVSRNNIFIDFCNHVLNYSYMYRIMNIYNINNVFSKNIIFLKNKFDENIIISDFKCFYGNLVYGYSHNNKIGSIIYLDGYKKDVVLFKRLSMQIVASESIYNSIYDIPYDVFNQFINLNIDNNIKYLNELQFNNLKQVVLNYINKYVLLSQKFIFDLNKDIKDILYFNKLIIKDFYISSLK